MSNSWNRCKEITVDSFNVHREIDQPELRALVSHCQKGVVPKKIRKLLLELPFEIRQKLVNSWYCKGILNRIIAGNKLREIKFVVEECGADVNLEGFEADGRLVAPVDVAVEHGNEQVIDYLVDNGAKCDFMIYQLILCKSVSKASLRLLDLYIAKCGSIEIVHPITKETPVLCAVLRNNLSWLEVLVKRGAKITADRGMDAVMLATLFDKQNLLKFFKKVGYTQSKLREIETLELKGVYHLVNTRDLKKHELGVRFLGEALEMRQENNLLRPPWRSNQPVFSNVTLFDSKEQLTLLQQRHGEGHADLIIQCLLLIEQIAGDFDAIIGVGLLTTAAMFASIRYANDVVKIMTFFAGGFTLSRFPCCQWTQLFNKLIQDVKTFDVANLVLRLLQGGERSMNKSQVREFTVLIWGLIEKSVEAPDVELQVESLQENGLLYASLMYAAMARKNRSSSSCSIDPYREDLIRTLLQKGAFVGLPGYAGTGSAYWRAGDGHGDRLNDLILLASCCKLDLMIPLSLVKIAPLRCLAARAVYRSPIKLDNDHAKMLVGQRRDVPIPLDAFIASHRPVAADMDYSYYAREPDEAWLDQNSDFENEDECLYDDTAQIEHAMREFNIDTPPRNMTVTFEEGETQL